MPIGKQAVSYKQPCKQEAVNAKAALARADWFAENCNLDEDYECILDGSWPSAKEILHPPQCLWVTS